MVVRCAGTLILATMTAGRPVMQQGSSSILHYY
jgi:hypothetical protein